MITGKGWMILRDRRRIDVEYQFGSDYDDTRAGWLLCDASSFDPAEFCHKLTLICADGTEVVFAVSHYSDRHLAVIGRVLASERAAA